MTGLNEETERLLLNDDPSVTSIWLHRRYVRIEVDGVVVIPNAVENNVERAVTAVCASTHLERLSLCFSLFDPILESMVNGNIINTPIGQIATWIALQSPSLNSLRLSGNSSRPTYRRQSMLLPLFLTSVEARNRFGPHFVTEVSLYRLEVDADDLATLFRDGRLESFEMTSCTLLHEPQFPTEQLAIRHVAQALVSNESLSTICLDVSSTNHFLFMALLAALQSHPSLKKIKLVSDHYRYANPPSEIPIAVMNAIARFFQLSTCPLLDDVTLDNFDWKGDHFAPIARAIYASTMPLTTLHLLRGSMDATSCLDLQSMLSPQRFNNTQSGANVHKLYLEGDVEFPKDNASLRDLVSGNGATGSTRGLQCLYLHGYDEFGRRLKRFGCILDSLTMATCPVLQLDVLQELEEVHIKALLKAIPFFCSVVCLSLDLTCMEHYKAKLLTAFRRNRTLLLVYVDPEGTLSTAEQAQLDIYLERNRRLPRLIRSKSKTASSTTTAATTNTAATTTTIVPMPSSAAPLNDGVQLLPSLLVAATSDASSAMRVSSWILGALARLTDQIGPEATLVVALPTGKRLLESPSHEVAKKFKRLEPVRNDIDS